jgi:deoxyribonuclease (pyrimidine dimer)
MVRINIANVCLLPDEVLNAEYYEIGMFFGSCKKFKSKIPLNYTMGKGHELFFKDKLLFVLKRFNLITEERRKRGLYCSSDYINSVINLYSSFDNSLKNDYTPNFKAILLNLIRLDDRIKHPLKKKNPYHFKGEIIGKDYYKTNFILERAILKANLLTIKGENSKQKDLKSIIFIDDKSNRKVFKEE